MASRGFFRTRAILSGFVRSRTLGKYHRDGGIILLTRSVVATQQGDESSTINAVHRVQQSLENKSQKQEENFETLFENSQFVRIMNPVGKRVKGEVIAVVGDNLYVDFGCKFHAVVKRPEGEKKLYSKDTSVVLLVKSLELTDHFLGDSKHTSLLEAEAELIGLLNEH